MSEITLQHHRTLWHFVPGLALSAVVTGVALWGGSIPAVAGARAGSAFSDQAGGGAAAGFAAATYEEK